jgi:hypothetical protein
MVMRGAVSSAICTIPRWHATCFLPATFVDRIEMFVATPLVSDNAPLARTASRTSGRIVWQQHYEGISHVAYRCGKAIAGVSGPWSDRYVLIWWDQRPAASHPLELFETMEAAKGAVEERVGQAVPAFAAIPGDPRPSRSRGWWAGFWSRRRHRRTAPSQRRCVDDEIDLSGLNFSATR